jgi:hypothetical protein
LLWIYAGLRDHIHLPLLGSNGRVISCDRDLVKWQPWVLDRGNKLLCLFDIGKSAHDELQQRWERDIYQVLRRNMKKKTPICVRIDNDMVAILRNQANTRRTTVTAIVHEILVKALLGKQGDAQ